MTGPRAPLLGRRANIRVAVLEVDRTGGKVNKQVIGDLEILGAPGPAPLSEAASAAAAAAAAAVTPPAAPPSVSAAPPQVDSPPAKIVPADAPAAAGAPAPSSPAEPAASKSSSLEDEFAARKAQRRREQVSYQVAAIAASSGVTALAIVATYLRFYWHMEEVGDNSVPWAEVFATLSLVAGGAFGMEMWARWAHKTLWHDYEPGWALHKSHHVPRTGPFEANDLFAIMNGVPAMGLCAYGFLTPGIFGGGCFGTGLGISLFGIAYMFIHDGLVHRRFPVGPIAQLPYMKKIAVAHQLHHSEKYDGAPWGMFLGPQELKSIPGATEELERLTESLDWSKR